MRRREKRKACRGETRGGVRVFQLFLGLTASANGGHCGDKSERGKDISIESLMVPLFLSFASPQQRESLAMLSVSSVYSPL